MKGESNENPETSGIVPASREPSFPISNLVRYPLQIPSELRAPLHRALLPSACRVERHRRTGTELAREFPGKPCDSPWTTHRDAACRSLLPEDCYEHPRLVDFPAPSMVGLRHPCRAGRARCFTTPKTRRSGHQRTEGGIPSYLRACCRPPDVPVARSIRGSGFHRESRSAAPRWQRTLVNRAKAASTALP